jgi:hypothetical protein
MAKKELVESKNVTVSIAGESTTTPGTPDTFLELFRTNSVDINDSKNIATVTDMDTVAGQIADQITQERTVGLTIPMNLVISSAGYKKAHALYKAGDYAYMRIVARDDKSPQTTYTFEVGGEIRSMPKSFGRPIGTGNVDFAASEVVTDTIA